MKTNDHLFITSFGDLHDTREDDWYSSHPLREKYQYHFRDIDSLHKVKATLRAGNSTDLGGYPLFFITQDGAALSFEAVRENFEQVVWDYLHDASTGWRIVGCEVNYEDDITCNHNGLKIPSAYGEDE